MPPATVEPARIPGRQIKRTQNERETMSDLFVCEYNSQRHFAYLDISYITRSLPACAFRAVARRGALFTQMEESDE
jgi:hypothetical protein